MPPQPIDVGLPVPKSLFSRAVLIDTGAFLAIADIRDEHHRESVDCLRAVAARRLPLFVTLPTIFETHRRILYSLGRVKAMEFLYGVHDGNTNILFADNEDVVKSMELLEQYHYLDLTLTDTSNMAIMLKNRIATIFAFDRHYLEVGFKRIPPL